MAEIGLRYKAFDIGRDAPQVLACALLQPLGMCEDGAQCGELAAFCVHPAYRGSGRGDSLLDYVEQRARDQGIRRLVRAQKIVLDPFFNLAKLLGKWPFVEGGLHRP